MSVPTINLQPNIPVSGTIKYADFAESKTPGWAPRISLNGDWGEAGNAKIYVPFSLESDLTKLGIIGTRQENGNYKVLNRGAVITLLQKLDGNRKLTTVSLGGSPQQAAPAAAAPAAAISRPPSQPVGQQPRISWGTITRFMSGCIKKAKELLMENQESGGVGEVATTLFNVAHREGLVVDPPKKASQEQLDKIAELCVKLNQTDEGLGATIAAKFKAKEPAELTEAQANSFIRELQTEADRKAAEAAKGHTSTLFRGGEEDIPF